MQQLEGEEKELDDVKDIIRKEKKVTFDNEDQVVRSLTGDQDEDHQLF